ncbi:MAG: DUF4837 family protein [Chlorobi bacterium]|nr:DUF4837 family protein [Chlorobiota bacterium]
MAGKYLKLSLAAWLFLTMVFFVTSCTETVKRTKKERSMGSTSEILVVVQNEQQWENNVGKVIRKYLAQDQYGLNQPEPIFKLSHIQKQSFSELFHKHRNLLIVNIDKNAKEPKIESFKDYWAKPQEVITITAPSAMEFVKMFKNNAETFIQKYSHTERERILSVYRSSCPNKVTEAVLKQFKLDMIIPKDYYVAKTDTNFMWIRKETNTFSQGLLIFEDPYIDTVQFSTASIIARTNRFQKQYVPGATEGSFMSIDEEFVVPRARVVTDFTTDYAVEVRGLWKVEGDFMGGPFLSVTFVDPRTNHIVTIMGYVYYPAKDKRDMLRQLEAIIYSTTFAK